MEKTLVIDGKNVRFKSNGAVALMYMAQFKRDLIKDILAMGVADANFETTNEADKIKWIRDNIDFMMFYNIAWIYAKAADSSIGDPMTWLSSFDEFPILDLVEPLQELLTATISTKKK